MTARTLEPAGAARAALLAVALMGLLIFPTTASGAEVKDAALQNPVQGFAELTSEQAKAAQDFLANALSRSTDGLYEEVLPNGAVMLDLQGRFQMLSVVRVRPDGTTYVDCARKPEAVAQPAADSKVETAKSGPAAAK